eukprot:gene4807-8393_t
MKKRKVMAMGENKGQLGSLRESMKIPSISIPTEIKIEENIKKVVGGFSSTIIITNDGKIYGFGESSSGQLGIKSDSIIYEPTEILSVKNLNIIDVACGYSHTLLLDNQFNVWSFGNNGNGQLGRNLFNVSKTEKIDKIKINIRFKSIFCGYYHSLILSENNELFTFGSGSSGQLGLGDDSDQFFPQKIGFFSNNVKCCGAGRNHSIVILKSGECYSFGSNIEGQLGQPETISQTDMPMKIELFGINKCIAKNSSAGYYFSGITTECGKLFMFGNNAYHRLGLHKFGNYFEPIFVDFFKDIQIDDVKCGGYHTLCRTKNGKVFTFGNGGFGQIGNGETKNQYPPFKIDLDEFCGSISVGGWHSLMLIGEEYDHFIDSLHIKLKSNVFCDIKINLEN